MTANNKAILLIIIVAILSWVFPYFIPIILTIVAIGMSIHSYKTCTRLNE